MSADYIRKQRDEWLRQSDYDLETAKVMYDTGRYIYCVFMCHLSLEKALKGIYLENTGEVAPKVHNLLYLIEKTGIKLTDDWYQFLFQLNNASLPTRYPQSLENAIKEFGKTKTIDVLDKTTKIQTWIKSQLKK
ncbi:MAG: HEPN domain-containing protein [Bacteroidales bacterium]